MSDPLSLEGICVEAVQARIDAKEAEKPRSHKKKVTKADDGAGTGIPAAAAAPMMMPPLPPPPQTPKQEAPKATKAADDAEEKTKVLDKIYAYRERFKHLKKRNNVSHKSPLGELQDELHWCEEQLGKGEQTQSHSLGLMMFISGMYAVEQSTDVWNPLGLKLEGLGNTCKQNANEFEPLIDELMIKYGVKLSMSVEMRLMMLTVTTVATVHMANSDAPRMAAMMERVKAAQSQEEFKGL